MRVMVFVKATASSEAGVMPSTELLNAMGEYNHLLAQSGIIVEAAGLTPSSRGARVKFSGKERLVVNGPFAETKELVAGFWIWKVDSLEQAIEWVKKCPNPMPEDSEIEIRPFFENEDFGEALTPEMQLEFAATYALSCDLSTPQYRQLPSMIIAGMQHRYNMETRTAIGQQWQKFVPLADAIPNAIPENSYGISWNSAADCSFDYMTGVQVSRLDPLPESITSLKIEARQYAVFAVTGHVSTIPKTLESIWKRWVPNSGLKIATSAPCFELYTPEFNPMTGMGGMEIWIPLEQMS